MKVILEAIVGSQAYGLATENSDIDLRGVYAAPTNEVLGLRKPKETIDKTKPDVTYHEVEKFIRLALKCNPSIIELLYMPDYQVLTEEGKLLVENRSCFLSKIVYKSYGGYAIDQARRLNKRQAEGKEGFDSDTKNRYAKHARHCFRLLNQGTQLLKEGTLTVKVKNRDELFAISRLEPDELVIRFEQEFKLFDAVESSLPDEPDYKRINDLLLEIRGMN